MNVKKSVLFVCLFLSVGIFAVRDASAECGSVDTGCDSSVHNCPSSTSDIRVRCPGLGILTSEPREKLDYLKVVVTKSNGAQKVYTLKNPPGGIADYPADEIGTNSWVVNYLGNVLRYGDTIELAYDGYGLSAETLTAPPNDDTGPKCEYKMRPYVLDMDFIDPRRKCGDSRNIKVCYAVRNECRNLLPDGEPIDPDLPIKATVPISIIYCLGTRNNTCPSATDCAFSKRVYVPKCVENLLMNDKKIVESDFFMSIIAAREELPFMRYANNYDEQGNEKGYFKGPAWSDGSIDSEGGGTSSESGGGGGSLQ